MVEYKQGELRRMLSNADVKGRSHARTKKDMYDLCLEKNLINSNVPYLPGDIQDAILHERVFSCFINDINDNMETIVGSTSKLKKSMLQVAKVLCRMSCISKMHRDTLHANSFHWHSMLGILIKCEPQNKIALDSVKKGNVTAKRALLLLIRSGCEYCNKPRVNKVYWQWKVPERSCKDCFYERTISDYDLRRTYDFDDFGDLGYEPAEIYSRYMESYILKFFSKSDVLELINKRKSTNFETLADAKRYINDEKEVKRKRTAEMIYDAIKEMCNYRHNEIGINSVFDIKQYYIDEVQESIRTVNDTATRIIKQGRILNSKSKLGEYVQKVWDTMIDVMSLEHINKDKLDEELRCFKYKAELCIHDKIHLCDDLIITQHWFDNEIRPRLVVAIDDRLKFLARQRNVFRQGTFKGISHYFMQSNLVNISKN